jgi:hypothetical protein
MPSGVVGNNTTLVVVLAATSASLLAVTSLLAVIIVLILRNRRAARATDPASDVRTLLYVDDSQTDPAPGLRTPLVGESGYSPAHAEYPKPQPPSRR